MINIYIEIYYMEQKEKTKKDNELFSTFSNIKGGNFENEIMIF